MPYSAYTLQTLLSSQVIDDTISSLSNAVDQNHTTPSTSSPPSSFFSRRPVNSSSTTTNSNNSSSTSSNLNARFSTLMSAVNTQFAIDSVEAWGNGLYLGTSDGYILHFVLEEQKQAKTSGLAYESKLENVINLGYGKKSVERILVLPQVSKAIVLCDSTLSFYSLPFFAPMPVSSIAPIKGVTCFTHDAAEEGKIGIDGTVELCVVKRRVMQIYKMGEFLQMKKEIPLHDGALFVIRHGQNMCLADYQQYKLINVDPINTIPLIPTPREPVSPSTSTGLLSSNAPQTVPRPVAAVVKADEFLMVSGSASNQTIGIFLDARGNAIRGTMQWSSYPKAICVEYPYIAALLRNNTIEIHSLNNQQLIQVMTLPAGMEPRGMSFGHGIKIHLDSLSKRLLRRPYNEEDGSDRANQIAKEDLQASLGREAARFSTVPARILVFGRNSVSAQIFTPLVMQVDALIDDNRIEEALEMTDQARNAMPPTNNIHADRMRNELDYIYQKCGLLMLKETVFEDAVALLSKGNFDPRLVIQLFGDRLSFSTNSNTYPVLLFDGIHDLLKSMGSIDDIVSNNMAKNYQSSDATLGMRRVLFENAKAAVQKYLLAERGKRRDILGKGNNMCKAIDTALLKLYSANDDLPMIYRILKEPNDCDIESSEKALSEAKRFYALSLFYKSKNMLEESLDIWIEIYEGKLQDDDFKDSWETIKDILLHNNGLPLPVTMRYTWWLMKQSAVDGVDVLIRSPLASEMDPDTILDKLRTFGTEVTRSYLEYLVIARQSNCPEYHTQLACSYVKDLQQEMESSYNGSPDLDHLVKTFRKSVDPMKPNVDSETFVGYLGRSEYQRSTLVQRRLLLLRLLQKSQLYDASTVLDCISEAGPLHIERTILYGRLGKHQDALNLLIHELGDFVGAETYCATNGKSTGIIPQASFDTQYT